MSSTMELSQDTLQQIGEYVKQHLPEWQRESAGTASGSSRLSAEELRRDIVLGERIVRVEEELKTERHLIREGFAEAARRSKEQIAHLDARFDDINKRFEEQIATTNARFEEQIANSNTRFEDMHRRFEEQTASINKRFEEQAANFNARFDDVNRRFEDIQKHTNRWMMLISLFLAVIGAMPWIMGAY